MTDCRREQMSKPNTTGKPSAPKLASRHLLQRFGIHPRDREAAAIRKLNMGGTRALCIATNHAVLDIGVATGVFASELTVPYYVFLDAGMQVDVASPLGGIIPVDPLSMKEAVRTPDDDRLIGDDVFRQKLMHSLPIVRMETSSRDRTRTPGRWWRA
jgi:hypothetical protein